MTELFRRCPDLCATLKKIATVPNPDDICTGKQGGYTDGRYYYQLFIKVDRENNERNNIVRLVKFDMESKKTIQISDELFLNHANDLTYNSKKKEFVAVHNNPNRRLVSIIDPESMTVTDTVELSEKIYCIAYNEKRDLYVVGLSGGQRFCYLDPEFNVVSDAFEPTDLTSGYITQGCACDDDYIYFALFRENCITVYDWNGNFVTLVRLNIGGEPENLSSVNGALYIAFHDGDGAGIYTVERYE